MKRVKKAGAVIVNQAGEIAVILNEINRTTLPKGTPEPGESAEQAARREIEEETGLSQFESFEFLDTLVRQGYTDENTETPSVIKEIDFFLALSKSKELSPHAIDVQRAYWVEIADLNGVLSWQEEVDFVLNHKQRIEGLVNNE